MYALAVAERERRRRKEQSSTPTWRVLARPEQLPPAGEWFCWYIQAGRGWGKTHAAAEYTWEMSQHAKRIAIVAESFGDGRDYCIEGETGIKTLHPELQWNRSMGEMTFPSGAKGKIYSAEDPESLRGPNNYFAWCDEIAKWRYLKQTWDMLMYTMRKGDPRVVVSTTPKPYPFLKEIKARANTVVVRGRTKDNMANLSSVYIDQVIKPYEGTEQGRQELDAEDLEDIAGALWKRSQIDTDRVTRAPELVRIVTAIDPSATATGDEAGIITAGIDDAGQVYVLSDDSVQAHPSKWAEAAVTAYHKYRADALVAESNNGGQMVEVTISTIAHAPRTKLIHASRGKATRAEPVSMLSQQHKIHHVGTFALLEDELCSWVPGNTSPNRLDAYVWAITELAIDHSEPRLRWL